MPRVTRLVGSYRAFDRVFDDEEIDEDTVFVGYELDIDDARRIELDDGRIAFVFEDLIDDEVPWAGRLESRATDARRYTGTMSTPGRPAYQIDATLWTSPDEDEWLLLGSYLDPEDGEQIDVAFTFEPEEEDDDDDDDDRD